MAKDVRLEECRRIARLTSYAQAILREEKYRKSEDKARDRKLPRGKALWDTAKVGATASPQNDRGICVTQLVAGVAPRR